MKAVAYLEQLPRTCRARWSEDVIAQHHDVIRRAAQGINPGAHLNQRQQAFVEKQLSAVFERFLMTRDAYGESAAAFHRDMKVTEILTAINMMSPCSSWLAVLSRKKNIQDLFDKFKWEPLISEEDDYRGCAPAVLERMSSAIPSRAAASHAQEIYLRGLVSGVILKFFEQAQDEAVGNRMANLRMDDWCLTVTSFCASCTGR